MTRRLFRIHDTPATRSAEHSDPRRPADLVLDSNTEFTKKASEWRKDNHSYAASQLFRYRAAEIGATAIPRQHFVQPTQSMEPQRQHSEHNGIHSCVNTSQINGMLWQGQISQVQAERLNASLAGSLREHFGELRRSENAGISFRPGYPRIAEHFAEVDPSVEPRYFDVQSGGGAAMGGIAVTELLRGSVVVMNRPAHSVLAVGYENYSAEEENQADLLVCDPLNPSRLQRMQLGSFATTSMIVPHASDPILTMWNEIH